MAGEASAFADLSQYQDAAHVSDNAEEVMDWAAEGLITSMSDTMLNPTGTVTRAQVAMILTRFFKKYVLHLIPSVLQRGTGGKTRIIYKIMEKNCRNVVSS